MQGGGEPHEVGHDLRRREVPTWPIDAPKVEHLPAEAHARRGERVDRDLEGDHEGPLRVRADQGRWPARGAQRIGAFLADEVGRHELADQPSDRAAGQPGPRHELGS